MNKCYSDRHSDDMNNWSIEQLAKQLDYCSHCLKYYSCDRVLELNQRYSELEDKNGRL